MMNIKNSEVAQGHTKQRISTKTMKLRKENKNNSIEIWSLATKCITPVAAVEAATAIKTKTCTTSEAALMPTTRSRSFINKQRNFTATQFRFQYAMTTRQQHDEKL